jgi:hypothetical protein
MRGTAVLEKLGRWDEGRYIFGISSFNIRKKDPANRRRWAIGSEDPLAFEGTSLLVAIGVFYCDCSLFSVVVDFNSSDGTAVFVSGRTPVFCGGEVI